MTPYQIGRHGQLQEWSKDFEEKEPGHRHMSHMYGLYPGAEITRDKTPEIAKAARTSLERRLQAGGAYTGLEPGVGDQFLGSPWRGRSRP